MLEMIEKTATAVSPPTRMSTMLNMRMTKPAEVSSTPEPAPFLTIRHQRRGEKNRRVKRHLVTAGDKVQAQQPQVMKGPMIVASPAPNVPIPSGITKR